MKQNLAVDVLCVGHASYDLIFTVDYHPKSDEKVFAHDFLGCGGGPAANAAADQGHDKNEAYQAMYCAHWAHLPWWLVSPD